MNKETKKFHLGDILSISTGRVCMPNKMRGIYDILNFMTNDDLSTVALPSAADECRPYLLEQLPFLSEIKDEGFVGEGHAQRIDSLVAKYGAFHSIRRIHHEDHEIVSDEEMVRRLRGDSASEITYIEVEVGDDDE